MRGGKREGAGRKSLYPTKRITIPIELEPQIQKLIDEYKARQSTTPSKPGLIKGENSNSLKTGLKKLFSKKDNPLINAKNQKPRFDSKPSIYETSTTSDTAENQKTALISSQESKEDYLNFILESKTPEFLAEFDKLPRQTRRQLVKKHGSREKHVEDFLREAVKNDPNFA